MKKIAFICELIGTVRQGGENIAMMRTAHALKQSGYAVDIYTYTSEDSRYKIKSFIPLKLRLLPFVREILFVPFIGYFLIKKLEKQYDFIFASSMTIASLIKPKIALIITCHLIRSQKFETLSKIPKYKLLFNPLTYFIMATLEKHSLENAHKIIVITDAQRQYLINKLHIRKEKIYVIPNGIDTSFFTPQKSKKKKQVLFVGRGTIPKGIDTVLTAADKILATIVIATTKIDKQFLALAKQKSNVILKFSASPEEMRILYSESEIFMLPSLNEEQPLSTMEAMACGLPVVVTKVAASDIAQTEVNGYIIPENNPLELSQKVNFLLAHDKVREAIGRRNRKHIIEHFDLAKITSATINLLHD